MKIIHLILAALLALSLFGCDRKQDGNSNVPAVGFTNLTTTQARDLIMSSHNNLNFVILDVRTPEEFQKGHLPGAILMNFYNPNFPAELDQLDKTKDYLVYCHGGVRSLDAVKLMVQKGFTHIYNLQGGIAHGFPVKPEGPSEPYTGPEPMQIRLMGH